MCVTVQTKKLYISFTSRAKLLTFYIHLVSTTRQGLCLSQQLKGSVWLAWHMGCPANSLAVGRAVCRIDSFKNQLNKTLPTAKRLISELSWSIHLLHLVLNVKETTQCSACADLHSRNSNTKLNTTLCTSSPKQTKQLKGMYLCEHVYTVLLECTWTSNDFFHFVTIKCRFLFTSLPHFPANILVCCVPTEPFLHDYNNLEKQLCTGSLECTKNAMITKHVIKSRSLNAQCQHFIITGIQRPVKAWIHCYQLAQILMSSCHLQYSNGSMPTAVFVYLSVDCVCWSLILDLIVIGHKVQNKRPAHTRR